MTCGSARRLTERLCLSQARSSLRISSAQAQRLSLPSCAEGKIKLQHWPESRRLFRQPTGRAAVISRMAHQLARRVHPKIWHTLSPWQEGVEVLHFLRSLPHGRPINASTPDLWFDDTTTWIRKHDAVSEDLSIYCLWEGLLLPTIGRPHARRGPFQEGDFSGGIDCRNCSLGQNEPSPETAEC